MRLELPEDKKLVHEMRIPIRWGDMDALGHVNNTLYFRYMEIARVEWLYSLKLQAHVPPGQGVVIVNAFCNFHRQFEYPGDVLVKTYVSPPGRSSFDTWAIMENPAEPGVVYASGGATTVWVDLKRQQSQPMPEALRQVLLAPSPLNPESPSHA